MSYIRKMKKKKSFAIGYLCPRHSIDASKNPVGLGYIPLRLLIQTQVVIGHNYDYYYIIRIVLLFIQTCRRHKQCRIALPMRTQKNDTRPLGYEPHIPLTPHLSLLTGICTLLLSSFTFVLSIQALLETSRPVTPSRCRILSL